jgi:hypothetical protein
MTSDLPINYKMLLSNKITGSSFYSFETCNAINMQLLFKTRRLIDKNSFSNFFALAANTYESKAIMGIRVYIKETLVECSDWPNTVASPSIRVELTYSPRIMYSTIKCSLIMECRERLLRHKVTERNVFIFYFMPILRSNPTNRNVNLLRYQAEII